MNGRTTVHVWPGTPFTVTLPSDQSKAWKRLSTPAALDIRAAAIRPGVLTAHLVRRP